MERKEFIKRLIGIDLKTLFAWAGILLMLYVLFSVDLTIVPNTIISIVKLSGFLLLLFLLFVIGVIVTSILFAELAKFFPDNFIVWLKKHGQKILFAFGVLLFGYIVYSAIRKEKYFILFFMLAYFGFSYLLKDKQKTEKL